jgi:hypothetical protein
MGEGIDVNRMRMALRDLRVEWQRHALERMAERDIRRSDVMEVLLSGEVIENYPDDQPFPSALFSGWARTRPIHVVSAFDAEGDRAFVVTVYEPDWKHFEPDFKTRRRR